MKGGMNQCEVIVCVNLDNFGDSYEKMLDNWQKICENHDMKIR